MTAITLACERARAARGEIAQSLEHVVDNQQRRVGGKAAALVARNDRKPGAGFERGFDEVVAVAIVAVDGEERLALAELRLSMDRPGTSAGSAPDLSARIAAAMASRVHSAVMPLFPSAPRRPRRGRRTE